LSDLELSASIVLQSQLLHNFTCILGCVLHSVHSCAGLGSDIVQQCTVEGGDIEVVEVLSCEFRFGFGYLVLHYEFELLQEGLAGQQLDLALNLTDDILELVIEQNDIVAVGVSG